MWVLYYLIVCVNCELVVMLSGIVGYFGVLMVVIMKFFDWLECGGYI